ncbi:hypothetical protein ACIBSW_07640 [Actinoplanes sp. NPDC049668]|uniref:hypothetical protein n=1 Tax=unclassified Actinoplanes TaxID=2626549 RepID=UPI0033AAF699
MKHIVDDTVPHDWQVLAFGSASRCNALPDACAAWMSSSDVDLLLVYPPGNVGDAIKIRNELIKRIAGLRKLADIVLLNQREEVESRFIDSEHAQCLLVCLDRCGG